MSNIILIGFMGSGKTTFGKWLADRSHMRFCDTDELIEAKEARTINDIFAVEGEEYFRNLETEILRALIEEYADEAAENEAAGGAVGSERLKVAAAGGAIGSERPKVAADSGTGGKASEAAVISVGGGLPVRTINRELMHKLGTCVYLRTSKEELVRRLQSDTTRPLLAGGKLEEKIDSLMSARKDIYESAADIIIDTDSMSFETMADIIKGRTV